MSDFCKGEGCMEFPCRDDEEYCPACAEQILEWEKRPLKLLEVKIETPYDETAELDCIGTYFDKWREWAICRLCGEYTSEGDHERCDNTGPLREMRYFIPFAGGEEPGSDDYKKYGKQDYERAEANCRGDWSYMGVRASAVVGYVDCRTENGNTHRTETLHSTGCWGVESDCGPEYSAQLAQEELDDLKNHLDTFGVDLSNWETLADEAKEA